jgi:beta-glucosidase-like glycosyl hydrolase
MVDGTGFSTGAAGYVGHIAANPRLCIPGLNLEDGPQGVADGVTGVTQLPAPVALAAAFDPALAQEYGSVVGSEEHAKGTDVNLGPTVNIVRDPRWGRAFESYGEDPYLSGQTTVGYIDGVQRQDVMAQVKHYAVYNQETNRNTSADDAIVSQRAMQEIYLPQFHAAVTQGHAASVMCSYATINGQYACENSATLGILDSQWHYPGFVTSDWSATHSTVASALAGLDMQMPGGSGFGTDYYGAPLKAAVQAGTVPVPALNDMVSRILLEMFRFRLFDHPLTGSLTATVTTPAHAQAGQDVAEAGTVLLKNDGSVLPFAGRRGQDIAVIGSDAGQYALTSGGGSAGVIPPSTVTPVQGITQRAAAAGDSVTYAQGDVPLPGRAERDVLQQHHAHRHACGDGDRTRCGAVLGQQVARPRRQRQRVVGEARRHRQAARRGNLRAVALADRNRLGHDRRQERVREPDHLRRRRAGHRHSPGRDRQHRGGLRRLGPDRNGRRHPGVAAARGPALPGRRRGQEGGGRGGVRGQLRD